MKMRPNPVTMLLLCCSLLAAALPVVASEPLADATDGTLYVTIDTLEPMEFKHFRRARADGRELILSTLKMTADAQARFAGYPGGVVVLDEDTEPPEGAPSLRLTWAEEAVTAELITGGKPRYLGVVNRNPLSEHPDFNRMRREIDRSGSTDRKRDAIVRAETQMNLYLALKLAARGAKE